MQMQQKGFDLFQVQDFLENKGMYSFDEQPIMEHLMNPNYNNVLRTVPMMQQPQNYNYNYQA